MIEIFKWIDSDDNIITLNNHGSDDGFEIIITNKDGNHMRMQMSLVALAAFKVNVDQLIDNTLG